MATEQIFDHLAFTFRQMDGNQCSLEELAEKADVILNDVSPIALENAMLTRGVLIRNGIASAYEGHEFKTTVATQFRKFVQRAAEVIDLADAPIMPSDLIGMVGLVEGAIPLSSMSLHLKKVGIWFIPGVGYWHKRHYVNENGILFGTKPGSEQAKAVYDAFKEYGWPMTALDLEAATRGKVTRRYVIGAVKRPWPDIISAGYGLYVPAGASRRVGFPMSKNIAQAFLELQEDEVIDSKDNTRMFRMCDLLQNMGYGVTRHSSTTRDGKQRRTAYFKLNDAGRRALNSIASNRKPDDEF